VVGERAITGSAASASQMGRFETEWLTRPENLVALADLPGRWIDKVRTRRPPRIIVLDMDSSESPTYGEQEGSAYNGHFGCTCYHPLFVFNPLGDVERCALRSGNVHSADSWRAVLEPVVARYRTVKRRYFRGDAAFANPEIYEFLEAEGMGYAIRLPANRVVQDKIGHLHQVDAAVMPFLRRQRRPPSAPCAGLQPRQFHADAGDAEGGGAVVTDQSAREAGQDRREGPLPRALRDVPDGRGRGTAADVCGDPDAHRPAAGATRAGMKGLWGRKARITTAGLRFDRGNQEYSAWVRLLRQPRKDETIAVADSRIRGRSVRDSP